jgi:multiple sugar transport system substrate-binding protein
MGTDRLTSAQTTPLSRRLFLGGAGALAVGATTALAGCSSKSSDAGAGGVATLQVWDTYIDPKTANGRALAEIDKAFMAANPKIKISHQLHGWDNYYTQLRTAVTTRRGPDVFLMYGQAFAADYIPGLTQLDSLYEQDSTLKDQVTYVDANRTNGKLYAMPLFTYNVRLYYNKKMFTTAGLDPETPPVSWADFIAACEALKQKGMVPFAAGLKDGNYGEKLFYLWNAQMFTNEESIAASNNQLSFTEGDQFRALLTHFRELYADGYLTPHSETIVGTPDPTNAFMAGKAAMVADSDSDPNDLAKAIGAENLGVMRAPLMPESLYDDQTFDGTFNLSYSIAKWTKYPDQAWKYLTFMLSVKSETIGFKTGGFLPNNTAVKASSQLPAQQQVLDWIAKTPEPRLTVGLATDTAATWDKRVTQVMTGQIEVDQMLEELEQNRLTA